MFLIQDMFLPEVICMFLDSYNVNLLNIKQENENRLKTYFTKIRFFYNFQKRLSTFGK